MVLVVQIGTPPIRAPTNEHQNAKRRAQRGRLPGRMVYPALKEAVFSSTSHHKGSLELTKEPRRSPKITPTVMILSMASDRNP